VNRSKTGRDVKPDQTFQKSKAKKVQKYLYLNDVTNYVFSGLKSDQF